jgi:hypothetical protein
MEVIDMKKTILVTGLMVMLAAGPATSQMMGGGQMMGGQDARSGQQMMEQQQMRQAAPTGSQNYSQYMNHGMMSGYGMGPQMMGGGYGMMGYNMGPQMMGGYGMNPGMMMGGYGMMPNMMGGYGYGTGPQMMTPEIEKQYKEYNEKSNRFLDETKSLRKELHALKFEYGEALRSTPEPSEKLDKMRREMFDLHQKIYNKSLKVR